MNRSMLVCTLSLAACARHLEPPKPTATAAPTSAPAAAPANAPAPGPGPGPGPAAPPQPEHPIAAAERAEAVEHLAAALEQFYVLPDRGKQLATALRGHLAHGDYNALVTGEQLADTLTHELVGLAHDKHLAVRFFEHALPPAEAPPAKGAAPVAPDPEEVADQLYKNHGLREVRRLKFNLGYLALDGFGRPPGAGDKLAAAMRLLADTASLIIDLRECGGGDPETVTLAESYLVPAGTHLLDLYTRTDNTTEHVRAVATLAGPRYAADKPVYVLVGEETGSGCEAFAYAMKSQRRATVIGGPTAGAAYFGDPRRLSDHFMAFVPIGRPIDPITHGDWEGVGVAPDLAVPPPRVLDTAERLSLEHLAPREHSRKRAAAMQRRLAELTKP